MHWNAQGPGAGQNARGSVEHLMAEHGDYILRLCRVVLRDSHLAEDAWQETWIKVWRGLPRFRGECSEKTWISRIAVNTCRDMRRSSWFKIFEKSDGDEPLARIPAPEEPSGRVTEAIGKLPPKYREAIALFYMEDMSLAELADALGVGVNTVSSRLHRGRERLKKLLGGDGHE